MKKSVFIFGVIFFIFSFSCCKSDLDDDFKPIHIDAPVISIRALDVSNAIISFDPIENATCYEYYYSDDNETFWYGSRFDDTSLTIHCPNYTKKTFYR